MEDLVTEQVRYAVVPGERPVELVDRWMQAPADTPGAVTLEHAPAGTWWVPSVLQSEGVAPEHLVDAMTFAAAVDEWRAREERRQADVQAAVARAGAEREARITAARAELAGLGLSAATVDLLIGGA